MTRLVIGCDFVLSHRNMFRGCCGVFLNRTRLSIGNGGKFSTGSTGLESSEKQYTRVADYYAGKSVFITGASGFLGKVFLERLLYNCKDIEKIFVLIRPKKGEDTERRLQKILDVPIFQKLKDLRPNDLRKVIPIEGDLAAPKLGIKSADEQKLIDQVSVVFHSAATVRFSDTVKTIMSTNLEGTKNVMDLTKNMKKLDTFVYISTAYSNGLRSIIDEKLYPPHRELEDVRRFVKKYGDDEKRAQKFLDHPSTYALSKSLCEDLINKYRGDVPTIIVRPSIVGPILTEPHKGWIESWVASTTLFNNFARGLISVHYGNKDVVLDLIPVDYVTNLSIVAGAKGNTTKDVLVYNICSSSQNPITWKHASDLFVEESRKHGFCKGKPDKILFTMSPFVATTVTLFKNTIPSLFADAGLVIRGKKPWHLREHLRAVWFRQFLKRLWTTSWLMKCDRSLALRASLDEHDRRTFPYDPNTINWKEYLPLYCKGVKQHLLKDQYK